jgi:RNA polymerase sigma-70 factor (ECF subfamily)
MAQRLVRAKKKITLAQIPFATPEKNALKERLSAVLAVLYLIFNEGYSSSNGTALARQDLFNEAIRLARILHELLPEQAEVTGLLALMLLHDARRHARTSTVQQFIPLQSQNRRRWDQERIREGSTLLKAALKQQQLGSYQLQACISAIHAESTSWEETDWHQIAALYQLLYTMQPTPVIRVNQAVAVSYAQSTRHALKLLETIEDVPAMQTYQPYFAAKADIYSRLEKTELARKCLTKAIELTVNTIEKTYLQEKLDKLG